MLHKERKKSTWAGKNVTLREEIAKLNEVTERYSKVQGEVEELEKSLLSPEELQQMEWEQAPLTEELQITKEKLKLLKGEVAMAGEEVRKSRERLEKDAAKARKNPWKFVAVFELITMIVLGSVLLIYILQHKKTDVPADTDKVVGENQPGENTQTPGEGDVLTPLPEEPETYFMVENLSERVAAIDRNAIAPFAAKVEEIDGLEYLSFVYEDLKISYANEYCPETAEAGELQWEQLASSIMLQPEQKIRIENDSRLVVYPWNYSFAGNLALLAPRYGSYIGAEGNQLIFFCENSLVDVPELAITDIVTYRDNVPQEIRMLDAEDLWEYEALNVEEELRALFTLEYSYVPSTDAGDSSLRTLMNMTVGSATYPYEVSYRSYETGIVSSVYNGVLHFDEDFELKLSEEGMKLKAVVYTAEKEYMGELSGELAAVDRELVLKNVRYGAYVSPYHEDVTSDSIIVPRTAKMQEYITISGKNKQRYYIALSDEIERVAYEPERLIQNEQGYFEYFDEAGNKISFTGVDVSKYQGNIDWAQVKAAGIDYAILRLGYRGMNEGTLELDPYYEQNIVAANEAGIPVGVSFFSQAITVEEAIEEAEMVLKYIEGHEVTYPIVFDTEVITTYDARANNLPRDLRTDICIAFCETIKAAGYRPMVYANTKWMIMGIDLERLTEYDKWYAYYGTTFTFPYQYQMLQYSDSGSVPGIEGAVDLDISFVDYSKDFVK